MIGQKNFRLVAYTGCALLSSVAAATVAQAGAFAVREQSAYFQGMGFAGDAAGGDISSMFWNPAATAALPGFNNSENFTGIFASSKETATNGLLANGYTANSADVGTDNFVPSSYSTYQVNDRIWLGLSTDAPFGFVTKPDNAYWSGSALALTSKLYSLEATPSIAYKITPQITIGAGVRVDYIEVRLNRTGFDDLGVPVVPYRAVKADNWGVGGVAGVIWEPQPGTSLGVGYRSALNVDVSGGYLQGPSSVPPNPIGYYTNGTANLNLPDEVSFSARQTVNPQWTVLGTVEWTNWSRIGNVPINGTLETLNLNYQDGWFFSVGAEYAYSPSLTFRGGVGYEISPITDQTRDILLPDSDRVHLSFGASYKLTEKATVNIAYSHIFFQDAPYCIAAPTEGTSHCISGETVLLQGSADSSVDIVSASLNLKLNSPLEVLEIFKN